MKSFRKHNRRHRHGLINKYKEHFKFFLFLLALVLVMIGNNFASYRGDDQNKQGNYIGTNYSPGNNKRTGDIQEGMTIIHPNTPYNPQFGIGKEQQTPLVIGYAWDSIWSNSGQHDKYYIQSAMNLQNSSLRDWEDYLLAVIGSSSGNRQNGFGHHLNDDGLRPFLNLLNQEGGGGNAPGHVFGALEYPHPSNYGGGYGPISEGGSPGSLGSGGSSDNDLYRQQQNGDPEPTPEPSTLILTGIGFLLLVRRVNPRTLKLKGLAKGV